MANTKISDETLATTPLYGTEVVPGVQSGGNVKISVQQIIDSATQGADWKKHVRVATTEGGVLSSSFASGQTVDGVTLSTGDRILIKNQVDWKENGIYAVASAGAPSRTLDASTGTSLASAAVFVNQGTQVGTAWACKTPEPITLGTSDIEFAQLGGDKRPGSVFYYESDTTTTGDTDSTTGAIHWSHSTQTNSTTLYFDNQTKTESTITSLYAALPATGFIMLSDYLDSSKWQTWKWTGVTAKTGYYKFDVTLLAFGGNTGPVNSENILDDRLLTVLFFPLSGGGGGGLTNFSESTNTSSPNNTVNANQLLVVAGSVNADFVLAAKGTGALIRHVPANTTATGNKRGTYAVDLQSVRSTGNEVASGAYSVVIGGYANRASADYSASLAGSGNLASNTYAVCAGGQSNISSGSKSTVGGGGNNQATGTQATVGGGQANKATNSNSTSVGGYQNEATEEYATTLGGANNLADAKYSAALGRYASTKGVYGALVHASHRFTNTGDLQVTRLVLAGYTSNATPDAFTSDGANPNSTNQVVLSATSAMTVHGIVVALQTTTMDTKSWEFTASIKRGATAGDTTLVASCTPDVVAADSGASAWDLSVTADTTYGALRLTATGEAGKTIRWTASLEAVSFSGS